MGSGLCSFNPSCGSHMTGENEGADDAAIDGLGYCKLSQKNGAG